MFQDTETNKAEWNKQSTPCSSFKRPIQSISEDQTPANSTLPEENDDPEKTKSNPSNVFGIFEVVKTIENESQHDSLDPETPTQLKILANVAISYEELLKMKEQDPYGALDVIWSMAIVSLKVGAEASTEKLDQLSESSKANLLNGLGTEILEPD